jgi:hypothetical protein
MTSSYYGGAEEPHSDSSDPDAAVPSPSFRPGAKGGNVLTGMASPKMRFDEAIGEDSPTPKARIMSAEKSTPMPVMMGRQDRPQYGSVEGSPAMSSNLFSKPARTDTLDWVKLDSEFKQWGGGILYTNIIISDLGICTSSVAFWKAFSLTTWRICTKEEEEVVVRRDEIEID